MELTLVNPKHGKATMIEPVPYGYIYIGATVDPPDRAPFVRQSVRRGEVLVRLKTLATQLEALGEVVKATVYRGVLMPPVEDGPRFDVVVLIETTRPDAIDDVQSSEPYKLLIEAAGDPYVMTARNIRRIADVDKTRQGVFLFNHFTAEDPEVALELWEHLAGWYVAETGADNSTLLEPIGAAPWVFVNHARWDGGLVRFAAQQFAKRGFFTFVRANLRANKTVSMPVLYRLA
ncbi:MAG TPA: hypothetical protein VH912_02390 [Streptosporangiaceae bacterium]|jgi:hypothetical protein